MPANQGEIGNLAVVEYRVLLDWLPSLGSVTIKAPQAFGKGPMGIAFDALS